MDKKQLQRIADMENRFDVLLEKVNALQASLDAYEEALPELQKLISYYDSGIWRQDHLDDENGLIPEDIKRGILSEDAIFDLLTDIAGLTEQMQHLLSHDLHSSDT